MNQNLSLKLTKRFFFPKIISSLHRWEVVWWTPVSPKNENKKPSFSQFICREVGRTKVVFF